MSEIKNLNPACIWKNFYALTQVPRPSGHLEKVQQFLLDFANYLKGLFQAFRSGKIHDFSSLSREMFSFDRMVISGAMGRHMSRSEYNETVGKKIKELKE